MEPQQHTPVVLAAVQAGEAPGTEEDGATCRVPTRTSPSTRLAAGRWLDEGGSFSSEAVARVQNATQMTTAEGTPLWHGDVKRGFTRRCGKRDPVDKSPCMHGLGHKGRHAWEPTQTVLLAAPTVVGLRPERG